MNDDRYLKDMDTRRTTFWQGGNVKLINGTEMIDNEPNEKAGELAEAIFDDVVFLLDLESKCITEDEDGNSCNTELGQDLFNGIYEQCFNYFVREAV